jgi:tRNA(fMet)-specific endonuclease VapC
LINFSPLSISAITEGEILYGLAKRPEAAQLRAAVEALLSTVQILPWDSAAARAYGMLRAKLVKEGKSLATMDMLIAAHSIATDAVLVTHDLAFSRIAALRAVVDWATDL